MGHMGHGWQAGPSQAARMPLAAASRLLIASTVPESCIFIASTSSLSFIHVGQGLGNIQGTSSPRSEEGSEEEEAKQ
jgi:hypothetical protein